MPRRDWLSVRAGCSRCRAATEPSDAATIRHGFSPISSPDARVPWHDPTSVSACSAAPYRRSPPPPLAASGFSADPSCDQRLVGKTLAGSPGDEAIEPGQRVQVDVALVQPERELVNVAAQVLWAGMMVDADDAAFEDREDALDAVGRHAVANELASAVIDGLVIEEQPGEATVSGELVSVQRRANRDVLVNCPVNGFLIRVSDRLCLYLAAGALAHPQNGSLANRAASRVQLLFLVLVGLDPADIGFVNLDDAGQLLEFGTASLAQPVQHEPCRLLRNADFLRQLQAAYPLPCRDEQVHRIDPLVQRDMRPFHDRPGANREVLLALAAAVIAALACRDALAETADRATRAVRPQPAFEPQPTGFRVRDHLEKLVRGNGPLAHVDPLDYAPIIARKSWGVKYIKPIDLVFLDESEALTHPYLARCWARRGTELRIQAPGQAKKRAMLGAFDPVHRHLFVHTSATKRSTDFVALLDQLGAAYGTAERARPLVAVLDNGPIHTSRLTTKALAQRPWLTLEWLPKYAPELNDIERCWRDLKQHYLANRTFADADALAHAIPDAVSRLNHERQLKSSPIRRRAA